MSKASGSIDLKSLKVAGESNKYVTMIDGSGIRIHEAGAVNTNFSQINSSGMQIYKGGNDPSNKVADFGETVQIGKSGTGHTTIASSGMKIYGSNGSVELANIGYGNGNAQTGTATTPYYTFGKRETDASSDIGNYSVAEGYNVTARGYVSHAEGNKTVASGPGSHAEGNAVLVDSSEYRVTTASGAGSHAEGYGTYAIGVGAHSEGMTTEASGPYSHAEGNKTVASGNVSHASGNGTIASSFAHTVIGKYNVQDGSDPAAYGDYCFIIGNGANENARSNALTVDWYGNVNIPSGAKYKINGTDILQLIYPVGSIYMSVNSTSPATLFGGTWARITGRFLLAATDNGSSGASQAAGNTGGAATVTLTAEQSGLPKHTHTATTKYAQTAGTGTARYHIASSGSTTSTNFVTISNNTAQGASEAHENMPPYLSVYVWKRTA